VLNSCFGKRSGSYKGSAVPDCTDGIDIDDGVPQKEGGVVDVYPVTSGTVIKVGTGCVSGNKECNGGYGNYVLIKHTDGRLSRYSHLYNINTNIRKGYPVNVNTVLGKIGNTGGSYGSHLDLKIYLNENMMGGDDPGVNPICYLSRGNVKSIIGSCDYMYNKDPWSICDTRINIQARDLCKTQTIPSGVG